MGSSEIRPFKETGEHSYHRRSHNHDYFAPFIYHIILKKSSACEIFGSVGGDARITPGKTGSAKIIESSLGQIIAKATLHLPYEYPILKLHQFCVMPDHVHILLQVLYRSDKHLDFYVDELVNLICARYSRLKGRIITDTDIFKQGYCDKPLYEDRSLDGLYIYISQNPHRLAMRKQYPDFFRRIRRLEIGEEEFEGYGNLFLFRNPDKETVKISRGDSPEEKALKKSHYLSAVEQGTVLVSPFIHDYEKTIRKEAEERGAKIILITHEAFPERFKPGAHDFALCEQGRLLIISLGLPIGTELIRAHCVRMNALARTISEITS